MSVITSPHLHSTRTVGAMMREVIFALVPGIAASIWFFGWGVLINLIFGISLALAFETIMLKLRGRPIAPFLGDGSAILTAILLVLAIPQLAPWWVIAVGIFCAIVIAKHLYGGLGYNPFNPAMVGFVILIISFPREMTSWLAPRQLADIQPTFIESLRAIFLEKMPSEWSLDALTMATPLDHTKTLVAMGKPMEEITSAPVFGYLGGQGWEWVALAFLVGGVYLLLRKIIAWQISISLLAALAAVSALFYLIDPGQFNSPIYHLVNGATILGAFFIATDPVTAATTARGRIIFGAGIGILIFVIRTWGGFPDGIAFAVLFMNLTAPTLDYFTRPRVFGYGKGS